MHIAHHAHALDAELVLEPFGQSLDFPEMCVITFEIDEAHAAGATQGTALAFAFPAAHPIQAPKKYVFLPSHDSQKYSRPASFTRQETPQSRQSFPQHERKSWVLAQFMRS